MFRENSQKIPGKLREFCATSAKTVTNKTMSPDVVFRVQKRAKIRLRLQSCPDTDRTVLPHITIIIITFCCDNLHG